LGLQFSIIVNRISFFAGPDIIPGAVSTRSWIFYVPF